ncbi:hypothetical protein [Devosia ginsengisoli]|uniref:Uncharacterized protein n=1 Tax=Devosia ginsengisoli TaxID=400770 RepID=A0A5B8LRU9_9HYPH|nr:hypothetical protein [Devosia ginsengisoli]QDZ10958.1 hypothetical protein FPZ08_09455 [Devosia ginsengisoli]
MPDQLENLRETLLRAGTSPAHVRRYLRELSEHRDDLYDHLRQQGFRAQAARNEADRRLGSADALLLPMLADPRFRSRAARWPALFYIVLPLACQAGLVVAFTLVLLLVAGTSLRPIIADLGSGLALLLLAAPVLIAWLTLLAAHRRRASRRWPIVGAVCGAAFAAALQLGVTLPAPDVHGQIGLSLGQPALLPLLVLTLLSLLPLSLQPRPE